MKLKNLLIGASVSVLFGMSIVSQAKKPEPGHPAIFGGIITDSSTCHKTPTFQLNRAAPAFAPPCKIVKQLTTRKEFSKEGRYAIKVNPQPGACQLAYMINGNPKDNCICVFSCDNNACANINGDIFIPQEGSVSCASGATAFDLVFIDPPTNKRKIK